MGLVGLKMPAWLLDAYRILARLRPMTRGEQVMHAQPCVKATDGHTVVLAGSENQDAAVTCNRVIGPSEARLGPHTRRSCPVLH